MPPTYAAQPHPDVSLAWDEAFWPPKAWYDFPMKAVEPLYSKWQWDSPETTAALLPKLTVEQHLLWAVDNIVGQICNGGFSQALYNSYGELAEEAIPGLRKFGLTRMADIMDEAWTIFGSRPIPKNREARIATLEALSDVEEADPKPASFIEHASAVFKGTSASWYDLESDFYGCIHAKTHGEGYNAAYYRPIAEWVYENKARFFVC